MRKKILHASILLTLLFISCGSDDPIAPEAPNIVDDPSSSLALVAVVENANIVSGTGLEVAFFLKRKEACEILASIFQVDPSMLENKTLAQIVNEYGEPWMLREISKVATGHYKKIILLSDSAATSKTFLQTLRNLSQEGLTIDVIYDLHSNGSDVVFYDGRYPITDITSPIANEHLRMRSLYQTCCYGQMMIDDWERVNVRCVNGAVASNSIVLFSPIAFLKNWIAGQSYKASVQNAFQQEIDTIMTYNTIIPEIGMLMTGTYLTDSKQEVGGIKPDMLWRELPFRKNSMRLYAGPLLR